MAAEVLAGGRRSSPFHVICSNSSEERETTERQQEREGKHMWRVREETRGDRGDRTGKREMEQDKKEGAAGD